MLDLAGKTGGTSDAVRTAAVPSTYSKDFTWKCIYGVHCPAPLKDGLELSDFVFIRAIGHGYASTVFESIHNPSKMPCVIKVCMKTRLKTDELQRVNREIENHSELSHKHILTFYAAIEDDKAFYIILKMAINGDLFNYTRVIYGGKIPEQTFITNYLTPLLLALDYLHDHGILHRDLKPENILIDSRGYPCICDFGLSIKSYKERPRSIVGTLEYMAPEVLIARRPPFTESVDVWAIGVLAYELITGKCPFAGSDDNIIKKRICENIVDYTQICSLQLRDFVQHCLQTDPKMRPPIKRLLQHPCIHPTIRMPTDSGASAPSTRRSFSLTGQK